MGKHIYAHGGWDEYEYASDNGAEYYTQPSLLRYEPLGDRWEACTELPYSIAEHGICALDGRIYVCGGVNEGDERIEKRVVSDAVDVCMCYNPATDDWTEIAPLQAPRRRWPAAEAPEPTAITTGA